MKKFWIAFGSVIMCLVIICTSAFTILTVKQMKDTVIKITPANGNTVEKNEEPVENNDIIDEEPLSEEDSSEVSPGKSVTTSASSSENTDVSKWTKEQIADFYVKAVNKTKAQKGNFTAAHKRVLDASVTSCTGGSVVTKIADGIVQGQLENTNEQLTFTNGSAKRSDGSTITMSIFPPNGATCSLPVDGIKSASAKKDGDNTIVEISLISETGTYETPPKYNSASVGYFDFNSLQLSSSVKIQGGTVVYPGSNWTITVNKDGLITSESVKVPIKITMQGSIVGITGELVIEGSADETWDIKY